MQHVTKVTRKGKIEYLLNNLGIVTKLVIIFLFLENIILVIF